MQCIENMNSITVSGVKDFDLAQTFDCGQCFRWEEIEKGLFKGVAFGKCVTVSLDDDVLTVSNTNKSEFESIWYDYFDLGLDYGKIREEVAKIHPVLEKASQYANGIRILRQEPYEALCTFIISQNNNIKRIKGIVKRLCEAYGEQIDESEFAFPSVERLARLSADDLAPLRAGFRNRYIIDMAKKLAGGEVDLELCKKADYETARKELMKITGVGVKVADCTLLFGMHRTEAFPIDVWMKRAMDKLFPNMTDKDFGEYAGIAQQYIFHYSRMNPQLFE